MKKLTFLFLFFIFSSSVYAESTSLRLRTMCDANKGSIVTGYISQYGVSHAEDNSWPTVHILFRLRQLASVTSGVSTYTYKNVYYFSSAGMRGQHDGYAQNLLSTLSEARFFNELVDVCVSGANNEEILGVENYPING